MTERGGARGSGYGRIERDLETELFAHLVSESFATPVEQAVTWANANRDRVRVWRDAGRIVGGLIFIEMGQFFGGRAVPTIGVAGVCVSPALRGRGTATDLMRMAITDMRRSGAPVSSLYPATLPLYRRAGYEISGGRYRISVPASGLALDPTRDGGKRDAVTVRRMTDADARAVERLYRTAAADRAGWLDRGDYIWSRIRRRLGDREVRGHVIEGERIEGYAYLELDYKENRYDVIVRDALAATPRAVRRLLGLLGSFGTLGRDVVWHGSPDDPVVALAAELGCKVELSHPWMLRLVDVRGALAARGYAPGLRARLELEVADDLVRANRGKITLDVAGGEARVRDGGRGTMRIDARALASLYTGFLGARRLAALGLVSAPPRTLAIADTIFAGAPPSCPDMF